MLLGVEITFPKYTCTAPSYRGTYTYAVYVEWRGSIVCTFTLDIGQKSSTKNVFFTVHRYWRFALTVR
jgi:hypothetical protein